MTIVDRNAAQPRMKYLNIVSIFPALTETFVLREIRAMQQMKCEIVIGQLRRTGRNPPALGFDDLRPNVIRARVLGWSTLVGTLFFAMRKPGVVWENAKVVLAAFPDIVSALKLIYILFASMELAYRVRDAGIMHVRGHHLHSEAVSAMFIGGLLEIPYSFTCHTVKLYFPRKVITRVVRRATFIVATIVQARAFLSALGATAAQVCLIRNGVPLREFPMRASEPSSEPPVILAVGRLDYKKGFHVLLSACSILRDEAIRFRCVIVGKGDEWNDLLARRRALKLDEHVEMAGRMGFAAVQRWYEQATLLVVPSVVGPDGSTDGLPTVIIEAFACGIPVVGSSTAGIPEIIQNGINGFVVAAGSARELANRVKELLFDQGLRRKFALQARYSVERDYDLDWNARTLANLMLGQVRQRAGMANVVVSHAAVEHTSSAS